MSSNIIGKPVYYIRFICPKKILKGQLQKIKWPYISGRSHGTSQLRGWVGVSVWCDTGQIVEGGSSRNL